MSTRFKITIRATSITVTPGEEASNYLEPLLDLLTYEDEFVEETRTLGFMYDEETDTLYLHKGVDVSYLQKLLPESKIILNEFHPFKPMKFEYEEVIPPRNQEQEDVINFIAALSHHSENENKRQLFLVKDPGFGKTYCSGSGLCQYGVKTLIIMHRDTLRSQWANSLFNMNGMTSEYVHEIQTSEELYDIAHKNIELDYDVYLLTHATFRAGVKRIGSMSLIGNITKNLGIGLKIIDEAHLEFRDTILMDFCFNVKRNLYLTATDGRSAKEENAIFRHVFANALYTAS
jgi:superfamily II DNA or RNA helicase